MGIPGLWAELEPAAATTTLPSYCLASFSSNTNQLRSLALGIDASLWLFHAQQGSGGSNPHLRTLFFRLARLLALPILPLFVFDGANRPSWKRNKQVHGRQHAIEAHFCELIVAFGFRWTRAKGEAEAELAYLEGKGVIDAILTDDSDTLLFGAKTVIRNWGKNLSGTRALSRTNSAATDAFDQENEKDDQDSRRAAAPDLKLSGTDKDHLITFYTAESILHQPDLGLDRDGLILVALLAGGDYDSVGLFKCGIKIAIALAKSGFGTPLVQAFRASYATQLAAIKPCAQFRSFVSSWLDDIRAELRSNARGFLPSKRPQLALGLSDQFLSTEQSRKVLACYVYPFTSTEDDDDSISAARWASGPDVKKLARACQEYFRWSKETVLARFRSTIWHGVIIRRLRQEAVESNDGAREGPWGALVESPASKAVRKYLDELDRLASVSKEAPSSETSKKSTVPDGDSSPKRTAEKPLHESPNATRITDFFSRTGITSSPSSSSAPKATQLKATPGNGRQASVRVLSITMQRRHAALDPFLDYRVQVDVEEFVQAASEGINPDLEAEIQAAKAVHLPRGEGSDPMEATDDNEDDGEEIVASQVSRSPAKLRNGGTSTSAAVRKAVPTEPLLVWIPEPLLDCSISGGEALNSFKAQLARKKSLALAKSSKSRTKKATVPDRGQKSLTDFMKPVGKASLIAPSNSNAAHSPLKCGQGQGVDSHPTMDSALRTPRTLRVPDSLHRGFVNRRNESSSGSSREQGLGSQRSIALVSEDSHWSVEDGDDVDSSIEFLGALVSQTIPDGETPHHPASSTTAINSKSTTTPTSDDIGRSSRTRPVTPPKGSSPNSSSSSDSYPRPKKSPKKVGSTRTRLRTASRTPASSSVSSVEDSWTPSLLSQENLGKGSRTADAESSQLQSDGAIKIKLKLKPRISAITISSSSESEPDP